MSHAQHSLVQKAIRLAAMAAVLFASVAPPNLWAQVADEPVPLSPAEAGPSIADDLLAPIGGAEVPSGELPVIALDDSRVEAATAADPATDPDMEVLTRGPVHEAYAETYSYDPAPGLIVNKAPPDPIAEVPPAAKPDDADAIWVPGYWAWDDDKMDFIWVSGTWRIPPPGGRWVPGYWSKLDDGRYQWVSGFWGGAGDGDLRYLPTPPASLDTGPVGVAPGTGYFWSPGYWGWGGSSYSWNSGFWSPCYNNWVWSPPRYNWTPRGCLFVRGCWDWRLPCRGQLFAPCYFPRPSLFYGQRYYTPQVCLNSNIFAMHFWVRQNYNHYYFGNYYGNNNLAGRNIVPWHSYASRQGQHDPMFNYYQARFHQDGVDFGQRRNDWHQHFVNNVNDRPPMNFREQAVIARRDAELSGGGGSNGHFRPNVVATTLPAMLSDQKNREVRLVSANLHDRTSQAGVRNQVERLQGERSKFEHAGFANSGNNHHGPGLNDALTGLGNGNKPGGDHTPRLLNLPQVGPAIGPVGGNHQPSKTDNLVPTKGQNGLGERLSSTGTLHLPKTQGLESPRKASGGEHRTNSPVSLGGATPRGGTSLPGGVGTGLGGGNVGTQHREHAFFTAPVTSGGLPGTSLPGNLTHAGANHVTANHAGGIGNQPRDIALPRFNVQQPRVNTLPLAHAGGNRSAPTVTRMPSVPQSFSPSAGPRAMTTSPPTFRPNATPRFSTSPAFQPSLGATHMSSGHLSAGNLSSGHMSAGHLSAGHVTGGHMSTGHLSTGHLSAGHVTSGHMSSGHMSSGHMSSGHMSGGHVGGGHAGGGHGGHH